MNASKFLVSSAAAIALVGAVSFAYAQTDNQSTPMPNATTPQPPAASPMTDATAGHSMPNSGRDPAMRSTERPAKADRH